MNLSVLEPDSPEFQTAWQALAGRQIARNALYGPANLTYYRDLRASDPIEDLSFVVAENGTGLIGILMQAFRLENGGVEISCHGLPCLYGTAVSFEKGRLEAARRLFKTQFQERIARNGVLGRLVFRDHIDGGTVSHLGQLLLAEGAEADPFLSQVIDLSFSEDEIRSHMTKTVRWSVNWGLKSMTFQVLDCDRLKPEDMQAFRNLHVEAAGRETRGQASWDRQYDLVKADEGFAVFGHLEGELVTAALFSHSATHCYYGVSASTRELFDKPIGHGAIWTAMLHAKNERGLKLFELGQQVFAGSGKSTQKEQGISFFKRSFGGEMEARLDLVLRQNR